MYSYPPPEIDWESYVCPALFGAALLACAILLVRKKLHVCVRFFGLLIIAFVTFAFVGDSWRWTYWRVEQRMQCRRQLQEIASQVHDYHHEWQRLPAPQTGTATSPPKSWRIELLKYSKLPELRSGYDDSQTWDSVANRSVAQRKPAHYSCPSNRASQDPQQRWYTAYAFLTGPGTAFPADGPLTLDQITDGLSNTVLAVEACGQNIVWTEPRDVDVSREALQVNAPGNQPITSAGIGSSYHIGGAHMALADSSARFISEKISPDVLRKLTTAAGGESVAKVEF